MYMSARVGDDPDVLDRGSPLRRAETMSPPVLLVHGDRDRNVSVAQSQVMYKALKKAKKDVDYIEYEGQDHSIRSQNDRIDMLTRIGEFLEEHLAAPKAKTAAVGAD